MRLIDADAFDADCKKRYCTDCDNYNGVKCRACWVDDMLGEVEDAPTVSPDEVRGMGKWTNRRTIEHDGEYWCTACGKEITIYMGVDRKDRYNYCPNCGARMEAAV